MQIDSESVKGDHGLLVTCKSKGNHDNESSGQRDCTNVKTDRADSLGKEGNTVKNISDADDERGVKDQVDMPQTAQNHTGSFAESQDTFEMNINGNKSSHVKKVTKSATPNPSSIKKPPDGGWGWLVAFGSFIITVIS